MTVTAVTGSSGVAGLPGVPQGTGTEDGQRALDVVFAVSAAVASFLSCRFGTELLASPESSSGRGTAGSAGHRGCWDCLGSCGAQQKGPPCGQGCGPRVLGPATLPCASGAYTGVSHQWCCTGAVRLVLGLRLLSLSVILCHLRPVKFTAVTWPCLPTCLNFRKLNLKQFRPRCRADSSERVLLPSVAHGKG